jgi:hypothetical protein
MLNVIMLNVTNKPFMLSLQVLLSLVSLAVCRYAVCHYFECSYAVCCYA